MTIIRLCMMFSEKLASYDSQDFAAVLCEKGKKDRWAQGLWYTKGSFHRDRWRKTRENLSKVLQNQVKKRKEKEKRGVERLLGGSQLWLLPSREGSVFRFLDYGAMYMWAPRRELTSVFSLLWGDPTPSAVLFWHQVLMWYADIQAG